MFFIFDSYFLSCISLNLVMTIQHLQRYTAFQMQIIVALRGPVPPCNRNAQCENEELINSVSVPRGALLTLPGVFPLVAKVCNHLQSFARQQLPNPLYKVAQ